ncbi:hypothetical protein J2W20_000083 [Sinomonas atrocyanea]|uniref:hypothetical protein n=1 Tax=Sinomonas atrocyanea TaxID=37927 RepID=UPI0027887812|nr:hypothetical protein [Sinomonas atrocyanea]MDQ0258208.1 hypothetical protein [Sinomonas atrocyanea]
MPTIVLIHGIAAENSSAASLLAVWRPALAGGLANAGRKDLSQQVLDNTITVDMAFYGNLFQGPATFDSAAVSGDAEEFARAIVTRAADSSANDEERVPNPDTPAAAEAVEAAKTAEVGGSSSAGDATAPPRPRGDDHGSSEEARAAREGIEGTFLQALDHLPWIKKTIFGLAEDTVAKPLKQVATYMHDQAIQDQVQRAVAALVDDGTKVIIGHSLGSVVAFNYVTHALDRDLPLLLTLGSPLGDKTLIYPRLVPQLPVYPPRVNLWVNVAARNDPVAANPNLADDFLGVPAGCGLNSGWTVQNLQGGAHSVLDYLNQEEVGKVIASALA